MNDKELMEGILLTTKGVCDLYMHGSIESATPNVHAAMNTALNESLLLAWPPPLDGFAALVMTAWVQAMREAG